MDVTAPLPDPGRPPAETDRVFNQPPPLQGYNLYDADFALQEGVLREGAGSWTHSLRAWGAQAGTPQLIELGMLAERNPPVLHTHDRWGRRRDEVEFHPAYHALMALGFEQGLHAAPWAAPGPGAQVARAAAFMLHGQVDNGTQCPLTMTFAAAPVLARHADSLPEVAATWLPRVHSRLYDPAFAPVHTKRGATLGMGMTERQGGSDVRANTTRAAPLAAREPGQPYRLTGHKWFFSAPMCDGFLVLANAPGGLSCFLLPRFHDGALQPGVRLQRLKEKLGNRANASAEVEFAGAIAWLVGDEGRGVQTILEMVNVTRLDCGLGSAGVMRQALAQALHHARHRSAFGRPLVQQPLMRNVLADLALESEAATALMLRLARTFDAPDDPTEAALRRLATPAAKFWICKRLAAFTQEAMEVLGGSGYVEAHNLARLYREAPLNSIWEGSGNIMCLDVLRVTRNSAALAAVFDEIDRARGGDPRLDAAVADLRADFASYAATADEGASRLLCSRLVLALQAALLVRHAPHAVADGFCASRIATPAAAVFGALPAGCDVGAIIARAWPEGIDPDLEAPPLPVPGTF